ncbi:spore cortex biosynthesis protein YabQ [Clostridium sp. DMHC 10]|uniref:spore cortex biosynthesis protein YabQ n=1 Tax=Clostridium sp. DMHC 10 TaxID=747377 RepID=UPI000AD42A3C|nr:spore cortex biosynthesis protein YabQ [Clostridium sp. DMHC 10]
MILTIYDQFVFLLCNFIAGIVVAGLFDLYRVIRNIKKVNRILVFIQDIIFLILCGFIVFAFLLYTNEAYINIYVYVFMILGIIFYVKVISRGYVKAVDTIIRKLMKLTRIIVNFIIFHF